MLGTMAGFRRFSVSEYHKLIEIGLLTENDNLELLEGCLVLKMARNTPHAGTVDLLKASLAAVMPVGWMLRIQQAITLNDSEPEPDLAIVRGNPRAYLTGHPEPPDVGVIIEVSDASLSGDRADKGRIYARSALPVYWIINLVERQIEVYTHPSGPTALPVYAQRADFQRADRIPLIVAGLTLATFPVSDLLP